MAALTLLAGSGIEGDASEIRRVLLSAEAVSGDHHKAVKWLDQPLAVFEGKTPIQLIAEGRADSLVSYLESLQYGFLG